MNKYRYGLTTLGYYLLAVVSIVFGDYICGIVSDIGIRDFSLQTIIIISLAFFIPALLFYIKEKSLNHTKTNWLVLVMLFMLMACGIYGIWMGKSGSFTVNDKLIVHNLSINNKIAWTLLVIMMFCLFYLGIAVFSKRLVSCNWLRLILFGTILVGVASIAYSIKVDYDQYIELLKGTDDFYPWINSFFDNKNTFGQFLFICVLAIIMLDAIKPHWWHFIYHLFFLLFVLFSTAFTAIAMSYISVIVYLIYKCAVTYKNHIIRNSILLGSFFFLIVGFISANIVLYNMEINPFFRFGNFLKSIFDKDFGSFTHRTQNWHLALAMFETPLEWAFGHGYRNFNILFNKYMVAVGSDGFAVDNTYIQILGSFGIVGLVIYIGFVGLFGYACSYAIHKKRYKIAAPALLVGINVFLYDMFETAFVLDPTIVGIILFFIFVMPALVEYNRARSKKNQTVYSLVYGQQFSFVSKWSEKRVIYLVSQIFLIPVLLIPIAFITVSNQNHLVILGVAFALSVLTFVFAPYMYAIWHLSDSKKVRLSRYILLSMLLFLVPLAITIVMYLKVDKMIGIFVGAGVYTLVLTLMFIFTWLGSKDAYKLSEGVFKDTLLPLLIPYLFLTILFIGGTYVLNHFYPLMWLDGAFIDVVLLSLYMFGIPRFITYKQARIENHYMISDLNIIYLNLQRNNLQKEFYKANPQLSADKKRCWFHRKVG